MTFTTLGKSPFPLPSFALFFALCPLPFALFKRATRAAHGPV
jgi:hypothetical protein